MDRRAFISGITVGLLAAPLGVGAQHTGLPAHTVGVLSPHDQYRDKEYPAFIAALRSPGYEEGRNLRLLLRSAEGKAERLPALAKELVDAQAQVIVVINTPGARAAIQATEHIPIVMAIVGDPVAVGFVPNLARSGGNVTGISNLSRELSGKRLGLVKEVVSAAKRIARCSIRMTPSTRCRCKTCSGPLPFPTSRSDSSQ